MNPVESRALRYFVAVAEELSFARAAERIGIAPPALSRAIAALERELGVRLLDRSTRHVAPTEAGAALLAEARAALADLDAAVQRTRRAAGVRGGTLVLAVKADVEGGLLEDVLEAYRAEHPAVPVEVVFTGWGDQPAMLRAGEADVAIILEPYDEEGLDSETLLREPQVLATAAGHPLATAPRVRLGDIEAGHRRLRSGSHVYVPRGRRRPEFSDMTQLLRHIELGQMMALLPISLVERAAREKIGWRPVEDAPEASYVVAWPQSSQSLAVAAFVRAAVGVASAASGQRGTPRTPARRRVASSALPGGAE